MNRKREKKQQFFVVVCEGDKNCEIVIILLDISNVNKRFNLKHLQYIMTAPVMPNKKEKKNYYKTVN